ncbi:uncharacterized protein [Diadema setosum]|uniref:uncharacterized protein n=1 Tax=Diadema setosum TaxID=31175 RepID=UPI003B3B3B3F
MSSLTGKRKRSSHLRVKDDASATPRTRKQQKLGKCKGLSRQHQEGTAANVNVSMSDNVTFEESKDTSSKKYKMKKRMAQNSNVTAAAKIIPVFGKKQRGMNADVCVPSEGSSTEDLKHKECSTSEHDGENMASPTHCKSVEHADEDNSSHVGNKQAETTVSDELSIKFCPESCDNVTTDTVSMVQGGDAQDDCQRSQQGIQETPIHEETDDSKVNLANISNTVSAAESTFVADQLCISDTDVEDKEQGSVSSDMKRNQSLDVEGDPDKEGAAKDDKQDGMPEGAVSSTKISGITTRDGDILDMPTAMTEVDQQDELTQDDSGEKESSLPIHSLSEGKGDDGTTKESGSPTENPKDMLNKMSDHTDTPAVRDTSPTRSSETNSHNNNMDGVSQPDVNNDNAAPNLESDSEASDPRLTSSYRKLPNNFKSTTDEYEPSTIETAPSSHKLPTLPGDAANLKTVDEKETKEDVMEIQSPNEKVEMIQVSDFQVHNDTHAIEKSTSNKDVCICSDSLDTVPGLDSKTCLPLVNEPTKTCGNAEINDIDSREDTSSGIMLADKTVCEERAPVSETTSSVDSTVSTHFSKVDTTVSSEAQRSEAPCTAATKDETQTMPLPKGDKNDQSTLDGFVPPMVENVCGEVTGTEDFSMEPGGSVKAKDQLAITSSDGRGDENKHDVEHTQFSLMEDDDHACTPEGDPLAGDMMDFTHSQMMELDEQCNFTSGSQTSPLKQAEVTYRGGHSFADTAIQTTRQSSVIEDSTPMVKAMTQDLQQLNSSVLEVLKQIKDFRQQRNQVGVRHVQQQQCSWTGYGKTWKRPYLNQR